MNKFILIGLTIIMFFFKNPAMSNYDKTFFDFKIESISGKVIDLKDYENKVILMVNTASHCGFTKQYSDLQKLWDLYKTKGLIVLGIPSDSFNQEKKNNHEVKNFCEVNFNINFPLSKISEVKGDNAHEIFKWAKENHGNAAIPKWNFHKILINKSGKVEETYSSFTKPSSRKIIDRIEKLLN